MSGTLNLVKSIVGAGVLALPAGVAAFATQGQQVAIIPASILMIILGAASAYSFSLLGRLCGGAATDSYREAWARIVGKDTAWIVTTCCTVTPLFACLAYSIILGDSFAALFGHLVPAALDPRRFFVALCGIVLWPLCALKSLKALAPTSALGTAGILYTVIFMGKRAVDGTYPTAAAAAATSSPLTLLNPGLFVLIGMLGTAYMAHFNAPSFYVDAGKDMSRFNKIVRNGFTLSILTNILVMVTGFLTFGAASSGFVLNNYRANDLLANIARALFGTSILFTFPLAFFGAKDGLRQLDNKLLGPNSSEQRIVSIPLALITAIALLLDDVGLVISLTGAIMGSAVIYILPALMLKKASNISKSRAEQNGLIPNTMIITGIISAVLGVVTSIF